MSRPPVARIAALAAVVGIVAAAVRVLRGPSAPAFTTSPAGVAAGSRTASVAAPDDIATDDAGAGANQASGSGHARKAEGAPGEPTDRSGSTARWAYPVDGECPPTHPIKAKLRSGIYHLPGMMAYDRARPDRCYATTEDAEADGLRRAKR